MMGVRLRDPLAVTASRVLDAMITRWQSCTSIKPQLRRVGLSSQSARDMGTPKNAKSVKL